MQYLHTMVRVADIDKSLAFYCGLLGLKEMSRQENEKGRFTLIFLAAPGDEDLARERKGPMVELTYNWDPENYSGGRNFGHVLGPMARDVHADFREHGDHLWADPRGVRASRRVSSA